MEEKRAKLIVAIEAIPQRMWALRPSCENETYLSGLMGVILGLVSLNRDLNRVKTAEQLDFIEAVMHGVEVAARHVEFFVRQKERRENDYGAGLDEKWGEIK